jgi:glycerol-3-phosphate dehydrogenase (NAD(P)+)
LFSLETQMSQIAIIGAGAWGTTLSIVLGRSGRHRLRLWAYETEVREAIEATRTNSLFLPGGQIPGCVHPTGNLAEALREAEIVVSAMPSQHCRVLFQEMAQHLSPEMLIVSATKGLEQTTLLRMTEVICLTASESGVQCRVGALSGPTFAAEVARGDPTAITIASSDHELALIVQREFTDPAFRVYTNGDVVGVELGGALKNIIAIAAGVCHGLGLGHNSVAALITRGLAEITRLAIACGARQETMSGLAGVGDLVLTCTGALSRNRTVGVELGRGRELPEIMSSMHGMVAEGVFTTHAALQLAQARNVEMPITEQMHLILGEGKPPRDAIADLMSRTSKSEI